MGVPLWMWNTYFLIRADYQIVVFFMEHFGTTRSGTLRLTLPRNLPLQHFGGLGVATFRTVYKMDMVVF
jgi:hypothetical protein